MYKKYLQAILWIAIFTISSSSVFAIGNKSGASPTATNSIQLKLSPGLKSSTLKLVKLLKVTEISELLQGNNKIGFNVTRADGSTVFSLAHNYDNLSPEQIKIALNTLRSTLSGALSSGTSPSEIVQNGGFSAEFVTLYQNSIYTQAQDWDSTQTIEDLFDIESLSAMYGDIIDYSTMAQTELMIANIQSEIQSMYETSAVYAGAWTQVYSYHWAEGSEYNTVEVYTNEDGSTKSQHGWRIDMNGDGDTDDTGESGDDRDYDSDWENFWDSIFGESDIVWESEGGMWFISNMVLNEIMQNTTIDMQNSVESRLLGNLTNEGLTENLNSLLSSGLQNWITTNQIIRNVSVRVRWTRTH